MPASIATDVLDRYAEAIVGGCLRVREGELVLVVAEPAHREAVVAIAAAAYRAGADLVHVAYRDPLIEHARLAHVRESALGLLAPGETRMLRRFTESDTALIALVGEEYPGLLADLPPARVSTHRARTNRAMRFFGDAEAEGRVRFCVAGRPTTAWAQNVYPELDRDAGVLRLLDDILYFCRLGPDDPPDAWERHLVALARRATSISELGVVRLEYRGAGNELDVRLASGTRWLSVGQHDARGVLTSANMPSEEIYTSPDAAGTTGRFRCSRPLAFAGRMIEGIAGEFRRGRLVRVEAARDADRDFLADYFATDAGAGRIGEIALLDQSGRIGRASRIFQNTLYDENAASHFAFGFGFQNARDADPNARGARGVNRSAIHLDVMIGTPELEVTALLADGRRVPLIADGRWQID